MSAAVLSFGVGAVIRSHAARLQLLDVPNSRSSHVAPTPRGGGLGIVIASLLGLLLLDPLGFAMPAPQLLALGGGGAVIAVLSFVDDMWTLPAVLRLTVHLGAAALAVGLVGSIGKIGLSPEPVLFLGPAAGVLTVLWIAGLTNAYNFMDGIDGLAGAQGIIAASALAATGWWIARPDLALAGAFIAWSCGGFLAHNWSPARLFMGDVGSAFLGYTLAVLTTIAGRERPTAVVLGVLVLWPFIFDPIFTLIRRARRGEAVLHAHRSHLYQRLVATGLPHRAVASLYAGLAVAGGAAGMAVLGGAGPVPAIAYAVGSVALVGGLVRRREAHRTL